jgi:hypothetical protein
MNIQDLLNMLNPMSTAEAMPLTPLAKDYPKNAKLLNLENLASNIDNAQLWEQHKMYPWVTNKGTQQLLGEIQDTGATTNIDTSKIPNGTGFIGELRSMFGMGVPLESILKHDKLFEQYPDKRNLQVFLSDRDPKQIMANRHMDFGPLGKLLKSLGVKPAEDSILINSNGRQADPVKDTSAILHELGHSIYYDADLYDHENKSAFGYLPHDKRVNKEMDTADSLYAKHSRNPAIYERYARSQMTPDDAEYLARPTEVASRIIQDRFEKNNYKDSPLRTMSNMGYPYNTIGWDLSKIESIKPKRLPPPSYLDSVVDRLKELF